MKITYHLDMAIETLQAIAPKQCDSYVDSEIEHIISELEAIRTYAKCFENEEEKLEYLANGVAFDPVEKPSHYNQGKFEVIDVIEDWDLDFHEGNVVKYVARHKFKNDSLEDLEKAKYYLGRLIDNHAVEQTKHSEKIKELE